MNKDQLDEIHELQRVLDVIAGEICDVARSLRRVGLPIGDELWQHAESCAVIAGRLHQVTGAIIGAEFAAAQQASNNVLNAALAGVELAERSRRGDAPFGALKSERW